MSEDPFSEESSERARIFIVRHAQSAANAGERTQDPATIPITGTGLRQAQCVADLISERPAVAAVSCYLRTIQTAEPLLLRYPGVAVEQWRVEEFTYLDTVACAGTTYTERQTRRADYWTRSDQLWIDGPGCECFADFIERIRRFKQTLIDRDPGETIVVFTHGFVIRTLLWLQDNTIGAITSAVMAGFDTYQRSVSVPNCAVLRGSRGKSGRLLLAPTVHIAHLPADLRTK